MSLKQIVLNAVKQWPNNNCTRVIMIERLFNHGAKQVSDILYQLEREGVIFKTSNPVGGWCYAKARRIHKGWCYRRDWL